MEYDIAKKDKRVNPDTATNITNGRRKKPATINQKFLIKIIKNLRNMKYILFFNR